MSVQISQSFEIVEPRARGIVERLRAQGHKAYYVGGCVRDMVMKRPVSDIDIATSARPDDVIRLFERTVAVGAQFGVVLVLIDDLQFEVATFRSDGEYLDGRHPESVHFSSPEEDAKRRDFTINGLFYDPAEDKIIDFVNGQDDINRGVIRAIGEPRERFREDKLRILRAVRFSARFSFPIEEKTMSAIKEFVPQINEVSAERVRDELVKMFTDVRPADSLKMLDETGLLREVLPEVAALKGVEQPPEFHPEGDVFVHTFLMMQKLSSPTMHLALAALFHDIGKPKTMRVEDRIRFSCHDIVGAKMTETIMKRLRFSNKDIEAVTECVHGHMNIMHVQQMRIGKLKRLIASETFETQLQLHRIDCEASHGDVSNYTFLVAKREEFKHENLKPKSIISGNDLIAAGLKPGPVFKEILNEVIELQLEGAFPTRDEALVWLEKRKQTVRP